MELFKLNKFAISFRFAFKWKWNMLLPGYGRMLQMGAGLWISAMRMARRTTSAIPFYHKITAINPFNAVKWWNVESWRVRAWKLEYIKIDFIICIHIHGPNNSSTCNHFESLNFELGLTINNEEPNKLKRIVSQVF